MAAACISLLMLLLLLTAPVTALQHQQSVSQMVVFSTRSRHTYGFERSPNKSNSLRVEEEGAGRFDLPLLEFQALFRNGGDITNNNEQFVGLNAVDSRSDNIFWAVPRLPSGSTISDRDATSNSTVVAEPSAFFRARVAYAASRAVLTHASFDMLLSIPNNLTCETATMAAAAGCELSMLHTEVVDMRNPNLSIAERQALLVEAGVPLPPEKSSATGESASQACSRNVLLRRFDGHIHVGHRTGTGPAAPGSGAPGIKPRRNYKGILGKLALKNRLDTSKHLTSTAMEPEIAIVMANLGSFMKPTISGDDTAANYDNINVLDPCCGSCSLLIAAAACGASTLVGVDLNATAFLGADQEFQRHGLPQPLLIKGSVLKPHLTSALAANNDTFHAILCDPPYGIGAPVLDDQQDAKDSAAREGDTIINTSQKDDAPLVSAETIVAAVLDVARQTLVIGGRLVMFVPVRGRKGEPALSLSRVLQDRGCSIEEVSARDEESAIPETTAGSLRLVHGQRQRFSPTFSRWLVVLERVR